MVSDIALKWELTHTCNEYGTSFLSSPCNQLAIEVSFILTRNFTHENLTRIKNAVKIENTPVISFDMISFHLSLIEDRYLQYLTGR